jgi:hypothetical protein
MASTGEVKHSVGIVSWFVSLAFCSMDIQFWRLALLLKMGQTQPACLGVPVTPLFMVMFGKAHYWYSKALGRQCHMSLGYHTIRSKNL